MKHSCEIEVAADQSFFVLATSLFLAAASFGQK
jgi:hypothetical protein